METLGSTLALMRDTGQTGNKPHFIEAQEKKALYVWPKDADSGREWWIGKEAE